MPYDASEASLKVRFEMEVLVYSLSFRLFFSLSLSLSSFNTTGIELTHRVCPVNWPRMKCAWMTSKIGKHPLRQDVLFYSPLSRIHAR